MIDLSTVLVSKQITLSDDYGTDPADLASQTSPVPDDLLAYLSSLEGIDVVTAPFEQGVGGTSARSMSLRVQPMADGMGSPCDAPGGCGTILVGRKDWGPVGLPAGVVFDVVEIFAGASHFAAILQHGDSEGGKILSTLRFIAP